MRTTLNIDDEIYSIVKELAHQNNQSIGDVISKLIHQNLTESKNYTSAKSLDNFPTLPPFDSSEIMTIGKVNKIREKIGD